MTTAFRSAYQEVIRRQAETATKQEEENKVLDFIPYKVGEQVLILDHTVPSGLQRKHRRTWIGPFMVAVVKGPLSYTVHSTKNNTRYAVHAEHMKRVYHGPFEQHSWPVQDKPPRLPSTSTKQKGSLRRKAASRVSYPASSLERFVLRSQAPRGRRMLCLNVDTS
jgi:hypothetical protein